VTNFHDANGNEAALGGINLPAATIRSAALTVIEHVPADEHRDVLAMVIGLGESDDVALRIAKLQKPQRREAVRI